MQPPREHTTLYLRGVPRSVVRQAKAAAASRGQTLARFASDALAAAAETRRDVETDDPLDAEMAWYDKHRARLSARYPAEYLAVIDGKVVDHDKDFDRLATRVLSHHGDRPVFMPHVGAPSVLRLRSPRLKPQ